MPSIAEATGARRTGERRRLLGGLGLLAIGAPLVGLGAAGTVSGTSARTGAVVGPAAVLVGLVALLGRARLGERERALASVGTAVALASLLFVWLLAPPAVLSRPAVAGAGGLGYLSGLAVLLGAVLAGVTMDRPPTESRRTPDVAWTRSTDPRASRRAADGGQPDDRSFPLEDD